MEWKGGFFYPLELDKPVHVKEIGKTIIFSLAPFEKTETLQPLYTRSFDYDILFKNMSDLCVRTRRKGDRIGKTKKLQDYFTDTKVPRHMRDTVALVAAGSDVLWVLDKHNKTNPKAAFVQNDNPVEAANAKICRITVATHIKEEFI
jgi:tRNA(Ile)-lysidine synthetase-like protein